MGCTINEGTITDVQVIKSGSNGLAVTNFTSNFNTLRVNEQTNIKSVLHNFGDFEARNIRSILYGEGLLERINEENYTESILPSKEALNFWSLQVPLKLSQTETTSYVISSRVYYDYNFSGFQQVGFVSPTYSEGDIPLSGATAKSPLRISIDVRNPVRTLEARNLTSNPIIPGTIFTVTTTITKIDDGNVDYFGCSALNTPPCRKGNHINEFRITVPSDWIGVTNLSAWGSEVSEDLSEITYIANYDVLEAAYDKPIFLTGLEDLCDGVSVIATENCINSCYDTYNTEVVNCTNEACVTLKRTTLSGCLTGSAGCYITNGCEACRQKSGNVYCNKISELINQLRMIRGEEARVVLQFGKDIVEETTIDNVRVTGDFGFEVDTSDFTNRATLLILGD